MNEVKRYDPMGYDRLSGYMQQHPEGDYVRHADYAALEAECERLRVKLMTIANAEPARHGIEWAKAHAAENDNRAWLKWKEAIDPHDHLRAELAKARELLKDARHFCQLAPSVLPHIDAWLERNA